MGYWLCSRNIFFGTAKACFARLFPEPQRGAPPSAPRSRKGVRRRVPLGAAKGCAAWCPIAVRDRPSMKFGGGHPAPGHGKISPRCVPEGASDGKNASSWQYIAAMYSDSAIFGKICVPCIRKAPQSAVGEHTARTSCRQGAISPSEALESCTAHESCHPLMSLALRRGSCPGNRIAGSSFNGLALAQGVPAPQRPANARHLPIPAARRAHHSQGQADELRWRSFGAWPEVRPSPEGPPTASSRRAGRQRNAVQSWA